MWDRAWEGGDVGGQGVILIKFQPLSTKKKRRKKWKRIKTHTKQLQEITRKWLKKHKYLKNSSFSSI